MPFEDDTPGEIRIGSPSEGMAFRFETVLPPDPQLEDFIGATIRFESPALRGYGRFEFFGRDVVSFVRQLQTCQSSLRGEANLNSDNHRFAVSVVYDGKGEVVLSGRLRPSMENPSELRFTLDLDQSELYEPVAAFQGWLDQA